LDTPPRSDTAGSPTHAYPQATPPIAHEAGRASDFLAQLNARLLRTCDAREPDGDEPETGATAPPRNKSFLTMTSSTLFGIYDDAVGDRSAAETPWGAGAETPPHLATGESGLRSPNAGLNTRSRPSELAVRKSALRKSHPASHVRQGAWKYAVISGKLTALYLFGAVYGLIVSQLHETRPLAAVHVQGVDRGSRFFLASWGLFGLVLGSLLPYVDLVWDAQTSHGTRHRGRAEKHDAPLSEQINDVVRSVCAFVGIAFAIVSSPFPIARAVR